MVGVFGKLFALILSVGLISTGVAVTWGYQSSKHALENNSLNHLVSIRDIKSAQIERYFTHKLAETEAMAGDSSNIKLLEKLTGDQVIVKNIQENRGITKDILAGWKLSTLLSTEKLDYYDIFLIDKEGNILFTIAGEDDLGTSLNTGIYRDTMLATAFRRGLKGSAISDMEFYAPSKGIKSLFFATPVKSGTGDVIGVLAAQITTERIDEIMLERSGLGETGETFLVGPDLLLRSDSRFFEEKTALKRKIEREAPQRAYTGLTGTMWLLDYRDVPVFNAYGPLKIPGLSWGIVAKIDEAEIMAPITLLRDQLMLFAGALVPIIMIISYFVAGRISRPIIALELKMKEITSTGKYGDRLPVPGNDEIGSLVASFNDMNSTLQRRTSELKEELSKREMAEMALSESYEMLEWRINDRTADLEKEITERKRTEDSLHESAVRLKRQREALSRLAGYGVKEGRGLGEFTEISTNALGVTRVGVWINDEVDGHPVFRLLDMYSMGDGGHSIGAIIRLSDCSGFYNSLINRNIIATDDVMSDPVTAELKDLRLNPNDTVAMLATQFRIKGIRAGIILHEHAGKPRKWFDDEKGFAVSVGEMVSLWFEEKERTKAENELRIAKELAEDATKLKDEFVSLVAHDLKNPIISIIGFLRIIIREQEGQLEERHGALLKRIHDSSVNMMNIIDNVLNLSRLQTGRLVVTKSFADMRVLAGRVLDDLEIMARGKNIVLENDIPGGTHIYADKTIFREVIFNIVGNAIKFCDTGGKVSLYLPDNEKGTIAIRDNGVGIDESILPDIFKDTAKTSTSGTAGEAGTGLGLPYSAKIMEAHGGSISVESVVGEGSVFYLKLPFHKPKLLLVDDDDDMHFMVRELFDSEDIEIHSAYNGAEAIDILTKVTPDIVVTDIKMPEMDGFELIERLGKEPSIKSAPIILVSSMKNEETRIKAFKLGADDFLSKPVGNKVLTESVMAVLNGEKSGIITGR